MGYPEELRAYVGYKRPRSGESDDPEAAKDVPLQLLRGNAMSTVGLPGSIEQILRKLYNTKSQRGALTSDPDKQARLTPDIATDHTILPTMQDMNRWLPAEPSSPVGRAASTLGEMTGNPLNAVKALRAAPAAMNRTLGSTKIAGRTGDMADQSGIVLYRGLASPMENWRTPRPGLDHYPEQGVQLTSSYKEAAKDARAQGRTIFVDGKPIRLRSPDHDYNPSWNPAEQALWDANGRLGTAIARAQKSSYADGGWEKDYILDELKKMQGKVRVEDKSIVQPFGFSNTHMEDMLDWDIPIHSQLPYVQQRFGMGKETALTPKDILQPQMYMGFNGSQRPHSMSSLLEEMNIPGFKYNYTKDPLEQSVVLTPKAQKDLVPMEASRVQSIIDILRGRSEGAR